MPTQTECSKTHHVKIDNLGGCNLYQRPDGSFYAIAHGSIEDASSNADDTCLGQFALSLDAKITLPRK